MHNYQVSENFWYNEYCCSHCIRKYKENRTTVKANIMLFPQAVRDELNYIYSLIIPNYDPTKHQVTVTIKCWRCMEHNQELVDYYNYCVKNKLKIPNKPSETSKHLKSEAYDITARYRGETIDPVLVNKVCLKVGEEFGITGTYWKAYLKSSRHIHCNFK